MDKKKKKKILNNMLSTGADFAEIYEEKETYKEMMAELERLAKLANADPSYVEPCKSYFAERGAFLTRIQKRAEANGRL